MKNAYLNIKVLKNQPNVLVANTQDYIKRNKKSNKLKTDIKKWKTFDDFPPAA